MFLTRLELDQKRRSTLRLLSSPGNLHGAVESAFAGERKRKLWRVDALGEKLYLLILSEEKPELTQVMQRYGTGEPWETRDYDVLLNRVENGSRWRFRLAANPVRSEMAPRGERGKVRACCSVEEQEEWLLERAEKNGFILEKGEFQVRETGWHIFAKGEQRRRVSLKGAVYEGVLTVKDRELFEKTLCSGIGRGKAYGMGLLTIVRG